MSDDILTVTFEQTARIHVTVNLATGAVLGEPERDELGPDWSLVKVRDENGLRATVAEASRAATIAEEALNEIVQGGIIETGLDSAEAEELRRNMVKFGMIENEY